MRSRLSGLASSSAGLGRTGRRFANRPRPLRRPSSPCSGRGASGRSCPTWAPDRGQQHGVGVAAGVEHLVGERGAVGVDRAPPISCSSSSKSPSWASTCSAAAMISGPMPSPGRVTMRGVPSTAPSLPAPSGASTTSATTAPARARRAQGSAGGPQLGAQRARGAAGQLRVGARAGGQLERGVVDVAVLDRGPGQTQLGGAGAVDALAEERQRRGGLAGAGAAEQRRVAAARVQADRDEAGDHVRAARDDAQVGGHHQVAGRRRPRRRAPRRSSAARARRRGRTSGRSRPCPRRSSGLGGVGARRAERGAIAAGAEEAARRARPTAPTAWSASTSSQAPMSAFAISTVSALRRSGAFRVITATPSSRRSSRISSAMATARYRSGAGRRPFEAGAPNRRLRAASSRSCGWAAGRRCSGARSRVSGSRVLHDVGDEAVAQLLGQALQVVAEADRARGSRRRRRG